MMTYTLGRFNSIEDFNLAHRLLNKLRFWVPPSEEDWPLPTLTATAAAVRRLKHWRAADPSGVWFEGHDALRSSGAELLEG